MISEREHKLIQKLKKRPYRRAYVSEHVRRGIAHQIRALREDPSRNWNQGELSRRLGKPQSVVSRMEDPAYGKVTVQTLLEVADVFDVALSISFVSFPTFVAQTRDLTEASLRVESFDQSEFLAAAGSVVGSGSVLAASQSPQQFDFNRPPTVSLLGETDRRHRAVGERFGFGFGSDFENSELKEDELLKALIATANLKARRSASGIDRTRH